MRAARRPARLARAAATAAVLAVALVASPGGASGAPAACAGWEEVPNPAPPGTILEAVHATGPADVWAVGVGTAVYGPFLTVALHWDGVSWTQVPSPNPSQQDNGLLDVLALSPTDAWAVGYTYAASIHRTLVLHWDGLAWSVVPSPNRGPLDNVLTGLAASGPDDVWAVGFSRTSGVQRTLVMHWDGLAWSVLPSPNPGVLGGALSAVAVASPTDAWAVGYSVSALGYRTLTLRWAGTGWTLVPSRNVGKESTALSAVGIASDGTVWAVGHATADVAYRPVVEGWDGSAWRMGPAPTGGGYGALLSLDARSANDVGVAGLGSDATGDALSGLLQSWDGSAWSADASPPGSGNEGVHGLGSVPGSPERWAVGATGNQPLTLRACGEDPPRGPEGGEAPGPAPATAAAPIAPPAGAVAAFDLAGATGRPGRHGIGGTARPAAVEAVDDAVAAGIYEVTRTFSAAVADADGDGWPDLFVSRHQDLGRLYLNQHGTFAESDPGTFGVTDRHACAWLDSDQDGRPDLFCSVGASRGTGTKANELMLQQPNRSFEPAPVASGLLDPFGRGRSVAVLDVNHDADPDLFLGNEPLRPDAFPSPNRLFLGTGGSAFRDRPDLGLDLTFGSRCAVPGDVDGDGWEDLLICRDFGLGPRLFRNGEGSRFDDVTGTLGVPQANVSDALLVDLDGDGALDLVTVTVKDVTVSLQRDGVFTQAYQRALTSGRALASGDVDGDGVPDLYVVQGGPNRPNDPDVLLANDGTGAAFTELPIPETSEGCGDDVAAIDYNRNGLTDFVVLNGCGEIDPGPIQLVSFYPVG